MKKVKVLAIDDEQIVLDSVRKVLQEGDYDVETTLNGRIGIDIAAKNDFDIVLTDIVMPDIGGMKVLRDVKHAKPGLPVLIITGYATVQGAVQAMKLGASDYIEKPFTPDQLLDAISAALHKASTTPAENQAIIHKDEVVKVLERASHDSEFIANLLYHGSEALEGYDLTGPEKLAILTGDIAWIEKHLGKLNPQQRRWLEQRTSAEIW